jgi:hypothetical protein
MEFQARFVADSERRSSYVKPAQVGDTVLQVLTMVFGGMLDETSSTGNGGQGCAQDTDSLG